MQQQLDIFIASMNGFWQEIAYFFPKLLAAILIVLVGWVCARIARYGAKRLLEFAGFDNVARKSGLEAFLQHGDQELTFSGIIGVVVYWLVLLLFMVAGANTIGLGEVASMVSALANYLPHVIIAILVMIFGTLLARFVNRLVFAWLHGIEFEGALIASTSAEYIIQIFALFVALEQLGVGTQLLIALFVIIFGSVFLALAIAFGLGGREWAAGVISNLQQSAKKQ